MRSSCPQASWTPLFSASGAPAKGGRFKVPPSSTQHHRTDPANRIRAAASRQITTFTLPTARWETALPSSHHKQNKSRCASQHKRSDHGATAVFSPGHIHAQKTGGPAHRMLRRLRRGCSLGGHGCLQLCHHLPGVNRVDLAVGTARGRSRQSASRRPMRFSNRPSAHHRQPLGSASTWSSSEKSTSAGFSSLDCAASARAAMSSGAISDARCHNHNTSTGLRAWVLLSANGYICGIAASCNMHFTGFRLGASSAVDGASVTSSWASQQD